MGDTKQRIETMSILLYTWLKFGRARCFPIVARYVWLSQ